MAPSFIRPATDGKPRPRAETAALFGLLLLSACSRAAPPTAAAPDVDWPFYGSDAGGQRFSTAAQITPANVSRLKVAWRYSTGDLAGKGAAMERASMQVTPILAGGRVFACSAFNAVAALDPATGKPLWRFDPRIDTMLKYPNDFVCRGVTYWRDPNAAAGAPCTERIYMAANDRRLFALDAATGAACQAFGLRGVVDTGAGMPLETPRQMQITSPPVVAGDTLVVGSSIDDNQRVRELSGAVRAYDVRTGAAKWRFDPLTDVGPGVTAGAANVWGPMSVDAGRGLVFLPVSSASPDFYGAFRPGNGGHANSVVALHADTGQPAWGFQTTHHDVWDYDVAAQPTLAQVSFGGVSRPAVIQATKQGLIFTLARDTGAPIIPVQERPVPQGGAPGEALSPTQPFPVLPRPLTATRFRPEDIFGVTPGEKRACAKLLAGTRNEGMYTPPSTQGTVIFPFTGGGVNWGGLAFDSDRQIAFVNTSSLLHIVKLIPAAKVKAAQEGDFEAEVSANRGAAYGMKRIVALSPLGLPCNRPPWGQLHAVDMRTGKLLWEVPLGTTRDLAPGSQWLIRHSGTPNMGGPIATATGLVFIGAAMDDFLRAFDAHTGRELWKGRLPAGGQATPMTYVWKGRQYVLIAAGGHASADTRRGDQIVAYALDR